MKINLPPGASIRSPASGDALKSLEAIFGSNAEHLIPLYRITNGFECVIRGGEFHLQLRPIEEFFILRENLVVIGSDSGAADVVINTSGQPATIELWCVFGGGRIRTLCKLPDFPVWVLEWSAG